MAATIPAHAVIASFRAADAASNALTKLKDINKAQGLGIQNAAVLSMSADGKLRIKETADMSGGKGMVVGGVVGGVIGLLGSTVLWPLGIGAAVGGLASKLRDSGFPNKKLEEIGSKLKPGDSLLIVAVADAAIEPVSRILKDAGADVVREAVDGKVVEELETAAAQMEAPATPTLADAATAQAAPTQATQADTAPTAPAEAAPAQAAQAESAPAEAVQAEAIPTDAASSESSSTSQ